MRNRWGWLALLLLAGCNLNMFPEPPVATPLLPPTMTPVPAATATLPASPTVVPTATLPPTATPILPTVTLMLTLPTVNAPVTVLPSPSAPPTIARATPLLPVTLPAAAAVTGVPATGAYVGAGMGGLRLRQFPDAERGSIMLTLDELTPLEVQGRTADSAWLLVTIPEGFSGWVAARFVQGLALESVAIIDNPQPVPFVAPTAPPDAPAVAANITGGARAIYVRGQQAGHRRNVFTTIGDSLTDTPYFLRQLPAGYTLAEYGYLLPVVQYFLAVNDLPGTSFDHLSLATRSGWSTVTVLDPASANPVQCQPGETPVACELRVRRAAVVLILIGTNDVPVATAAEYRPRLERIVEICIEQGVVPVLSTLPTRYDLPERVRDYNEVIVATARRYDVPLWDLNAALAGLPAAGIDPDGVHLSIPPGGAAATVDFSAANLQYGTVIRNLTALQLLERLLNEVMY
ncbi:MAG: GDSL-type esterase/lipase family protein [Anaerolineae bacterium]|nr:GDSL-type esterase/lipase family protein [Anaerolineae bacterium]